MKKASIYRELDFDDTKPKITVLLESEFTKEIRIAFEKEQVMKEHQTRFPIVVEIVSGKIDFGVEKQVHHLEKGDLIALAGSVPHDLKALEQSIVRLTLSKQDTSDRVKRVL